MPTHTRSDISPIDFLPEFELLLCCGNFGELRCFIVFLEQYCMCWRATEK